MANVCENNLYVYSENKKNIEIVKKFFEDWSYDGSADIEGDSESLQIYFSSKWTFPRLEMEKLHELIPDKDDIYMRCLSYEFGELYHDLLVDDGNGWESV